MALLIENNAYSRVAASLAIDGTTLIVDTGTGDRFPIAGSGNYFKLTLQDAANNIEIIKVNARAASSDSLTIERAQEGTTARAWNIGDIVELRLTAGVVAPLQVLEEADTAALIRGKIEVPTRTGGDATGTWGISITGNAASASVLQTARTINGVSFNGSANITITANTPNSITFNNGGGGGGSGSVFNGGGPLTVSYNTVGAPSTTGVNASGTWAISISGNAATVTNGVVTTGSYANPAWITALDAGKLTSGTVPAARLSGSYAINISGNAATATNATSADLIDGRSFLNSDVANPIVGANALLTNGIGYVNAVSLFGQVDGALYGQFYDSTFGHQIFGDYRTGQLAIRGRASSSFTAWRTVLDSTNYNAYSPSLAGVGANGTWGINITGNAATATTASDSNTLNGFGSDTAASANSIMRRDASGNAYWQYGHQSSPDGENPAISQVMVTANGDSFMRKASLAHVSNSLATSLNSRYVLKDQTAGAVGSLAFMRYESAAPGGNLAPDETVAGSFLRFGSVNSGVDLRDTTITPSGTWRCLGGGDVQVTAFTLFQRIA